MLKSTVKYLFFLDIDGTLLDSKYKTNYLGLKRKIESLQARQKFAFCLNSNRSIQDLLPVAKQFGIKGPLICENGLFAYLPKSNREVLLTDKKMLNMLISVKNSFKKWILQYGQELKLKIIYRKTDTVKLMNDSGAKKNFENSIFVFDNKFRKYTISAHVRRFTSGNMNKDLNSLKKLQKFITEKVKILGLSDSIEIGSSDTFGNLLVYSKLISKRTGVKHLINNYYRGYKVIAIGDESSDARMVQDIGEFWTLNNATAEVKNVANKVAIESHTKGVNELLLNL